MPFFSVIVPIYKVEKYLTDCIKSVLKQKFENFELILVDDGSPDDCGRICEEYAKYDNRIKVIRKENGGPSEARNSGLDVAIGKYILFLDGDDYLTLSSLENIYLFLKEENDVDMLTCAHVDVFLEGKEELQLFSLDETKSSMSRSEYLLRLAEVDGAYWAAWKNVYRRKIIVQNKLMFKTELMCAEDCAFFMEYIRCSNKFCFLNKPTVYYRLMREGSITKTMSYSALLDQLQVFHENYKIYENNIEKNSQYLKIFFANKFANVIPFLCFLKSREDINNIISYLRNHESILNNTSGRKYLGARVIWHILGYYKGSILLNSINSKLILTKKYIVR